MGKRPAARQGSPLWVTTADLPTSAGHPFFERLNRVLEEAGFDAFVEGLCAVFYAARMGRPSLRPGRYFRMLLIGYFEGLSSERGIAWRVADSLSLRSFLDLDVTEASPDHSTLSRTRRLIDVETHEAVFTWVLERLSAAGLLRGKTVGVDATTLEANAAMRSIERRDTGESYEAFIRRLAEASGVETPTRAELARFDRSRKNKKTSNKDWKSPQDPDAKIAKMKDGRTHLAHKVEHGVDMETGAIVSVTVQDASDGDSGRAHLRRQGRGAASRGPARGDAAGGRAAASATRAALRVPASAARGEEAREADGDGGRRLRGRAVRAQRGGIPARLDAPAAGGQYPEGQDPGRAAPPGGQTGLELTLAGLKAARARGRKGGRECPGAGARTGRYHQDRWLRQRRPGPSVSSSPHSGQVRPLCSLTSAAIPQR